MKTKQYLSKKIMSKTYFTIVEYLNELEIHGYETLIILTYQSIIMMINQIHNLSNNNGVITYLQQVGIVDFLKDIIKIQGEWIAITFIIVLHLMLFAIVGLIIWSVIYNWFIYDNRDQQLNKLLLILQNHQLTKIIRIFMATIQYIYIPIATAFCVIIIQEYGGIYEILSFLLLILIPIFYILIEYHQLQINLQTNLNYPLARTNFSSNVFDVLLVYIHQILINAFSGGTALGIGISIVVIRILLSYTSPFYDDKLKKVHTFIQCSDLIICAGMLATLLTQQPLIFLAIGLILIYLLHKVMFNTENIDYWKLSNGVSSKLEECMLDLNKKGTFSQVYRELLFLQRQTTNHRELLLVHILKKRCFKAENSSRGGAKIIKTQDLLNYEKKFLNIIHNFLLIANHSISLMKFMQAKEPKCQIFIEEISYVVDIIQETKSLIMQMFKTNAKSADAIDLALILSSSLYNDEEFYKKVQDFARQQIQSLIQRRERKKLFNANSGVIFISLLEEIGRITKVSKNIKAVLGYSSYDLIGLSINEIMPFSIRPFHEETLLNFLEKYNKKTFTTDPFIRFYAYNKEFHLQQVIINYYFSMNNFDNFELSGLFKQANNDHSIIITDALGNIQGWTADLGDSFGLDNYNQHDCRQYNIFPRIPALIKYLVDSSVNKIEIRTLLFIPQNQKNPKLKIYESNHKKVQNANEIVLKQINTFGQLLDGQEFFEIKLINLRFETIVFCNGNVKFRKIEILKIEPIKNQQEILERLRQPEEIKQQRKITEVYVNTFGSQMEEAAVVNSEESQKPIKNNTFKFDFKFGLAKEDALNASDLNLYEQIDDEDNCQISIKQSQLIQTKENSSHTIRSNKNKPASNFTPSLGRAKFNIFFYPLPIIFIVLILYDDIQIQTFKVNMLSECSSVYKRNYAYMIYAKSSFNPNLTYINTFNGAKLMQNKNWMDGQYIDYLTEDNIIMNISQFYLFNIQIPATLDRLVQTNNFTELKNNFAKVITLFDNRIFNSRQQWIDSVNSLKLYWTIRFVFICFQSIFYVCFLIYMYLQAQKQNKIVEAFFKFEKVDLDEKSGRLRDCIGQIEARTEEWYFSREFVNFVKEKGLINIPYKNSSLTILANQQKIIFDITPERELKIERKKMISLIAFIGIFLVGQITFLVVYGVISSQLINIQKQIPLSLDDSYKLIVQPNLQLANLFIPIDKSIITKYQAVTSVTLSEPTSSLPKLFPLLQQAPCNNCTFLYPLLTTNYRSFFSSFQSTISFLYQNNNNSNVTQLFYALDVVVQGIISGFSLASTPILSPTLALYIASLVIFMVAGYIGYKRIERQTSHLEIFLKYFDDEMLMKNKHMNNIVKKTI